MTNNIKANKFNIFPIPMAGLVLGIAVLGNLLQSYNESFRILCGIISGILFLFFTIRIITNWSLFLEDMKNVAFTSIMPTYTMAIMVLATYIKSYFGDWASIVWYIGLILHIILLIYFCINFVFKGFNVDEVMPSWYIPFVGIAVAGVTGKAFNQQIGQWTFYFGIILYFILMPFIVRKVFVKKDIKAPLLPTITIAAAPGGLCLAAYMNGFDEKSIKFIIFMVAISQLYYLLILFNIPRVFKNGFFPSYSAFTFPLIITALALKLANSVLQNNILSILVTIEVIIATVVTVYVLIEYLRFLLKEYKKA